MQWRNLKDREEHPSGPIVRTRRFHCWGLGSIPDQGAKIPQASHKQKIYIYIKRQRVYWEQVFTTFNTDKVQILKI